MRVTRRCGAKNWRWLAGSTIAAALIVAIVLMLTGQLAAVEPKTDRLMFGDSSGVQATITMAGSFDFNNPFFQQLGTNGRTCFSCHRPDEAWTMTPAGLQRRFEASQGEDPVFSTNDGSNCEGAAATTLDGRRKAFSLLLAKGLIRVGLAVPGDAEFNIVNVDDPYGCGVPLDRASMYRRPLPATNLRFLSTVMWDGRETIKGQSIADDLGHQAQDATMGHEEGAAPSADQLKAIVDFESSLVTAQSQDRVAGGLAASGATGGPQALVTQPFCIGVNDPLGMLPAMPGACATPSSAFDPVVFTVFRAWEHATSPARRAIARGEQIFNTRQFVIDNVAGLNAGPQDPVAGPIRGGTCSMCHDTPNVGDHSVALPLNIGIADASRRTPDLPLYTLMNKTTGDTVQTTDPGRAMVTGKWADIGKFKGPILRALAARAPYFHNGSAVSLADVVDFYNVRFHIGLTAQEKADLIAFLSAL